MLGMIQQTDGSNSWVMTVVQQTMVMFTSTLWPRSLSGITSLAFVLSNVQVCSELLLQHSDITLTVCSPLLVVSFVHMFSFFFFLFFV